MFRGYLGFFWFRDWSLRSRDSGLGFGVRGLRLWVWGLGFGFRVSGVIRVQGNDNGVP